MANVYTAIVKQEEDAWIGWIEEVPGVFAQEYSREELLESLKEALKDMLAYYREQALSEVKGNYEELSVAL